MWFGHYQKEINILIPENIWKANISKAMGGRVAEEIDFWPCRKLPRELHPIYKWLLNLAKDMVTRFGMSEELGPLTYGENEEEVFLGRSNN